MTSISIIPFSFPIHLSMFFFTVSPTGRRAATTIHGLSHHTWSTDLCTFPASRRNGRTMARAASHQNIWTCLTNIALKNGGEKVCSFDSVKLKLFMVLKIRTLRLLVWWQSLEASIYQHGWSSFELWVLSAHPNPQRAGIPSAATTQLVSMVENYRDLSMRHEMSLNSMWRFFVDRSCRSLSRPKTSTVSSKERCLVRITSYQQLLLHLMSSWGCPMVSKTAKQLFQFNL